MTKFIYMKLLGFLMVILGFGYCMTSFHNFYSYIFGDLIIANANIFIMGMGLIFPLYTFIFGVFFYFYSDKEFGSINPFILFSGIMMLIVGVSRLFVSTGIMEFLHYSYSFVMIFLAIMLIYGCIRYKY